MTNYLHKLKGGCITFRERVFGTLYQQFFYSRTLKQNSIDLVSVWTMSDKSSRDRSGGRSINFIYSDKELLTMESLFDFINLFSFHIFCLNSMVYYGIKEVKRIWNKQTSYLGTPYSLKAGFQRGTQEFTL